MKGQAYRPTSLPPSRSLGSNPISRSLETSSPIRRSGGKPAAARRAQARPASRAAFTSESGSSWANTSTREMYSAATLSWRGDRARHPPSASKRRPRNPTRQAGGVWTNRQHGFGLSGSVHATRAPMRWPDIPSTPQSSTHSTMTGIYAPKEQQQCRVESGNRACRKRSVRFCDHTRIELRVWGRGRPKGRREAKAPESTRRGRAGRWVRSDA